jgi:GH15 family glucan-1,4-alpha-glucosidase
MSTDGAEGTFLVCTFWLVQALAQQGDDERAGAVFVRALAGATTWAC